jgi:glutathione S-transferase
MLKIYGRTNSVNVQKVTWCADELGLRYERIDAGGAFGVVNTPEYAALNPNQMIPVIDDDGFVLWESNAIVRYLCARYSMGTLCPADAQARARADQWMDWQATTYNPNVGPVFIQLIRTPPEKRDMALVESNCALAEKRLALLDAHLARNTYINGDAFSMADIPAGCSTHRWYRFPITRQSHPNVERWYEALKARPAAQATFGVALT